MSAAVKIPEAANTQPATSTDAAAVRPPNPGIRGPLVLAIKGKDDSKAALTMTRMISEKIGQGVELVSVVEPVLQYGFPPEVTVAGLNVDTAVLASRSREVETLLPSSESTPKWTAVVRLGHVPSEVAAVAREKNASMIVVGASPSRRHRRIVAGHRSGQVLHKSATPVLSVAPWFRALPVNVLAAVDLNAPSVYAAMVALSIMPRGARMTLFHAAPPAFPFSVRTPEDEIFRTSLDAELRRVATFLRAYAPDVTITQKVVTGDPLTEIMRLSGENDFDLITVGTRSGSFAHRVLVGSVATEVFHSALCSVLASPPPPTAIRMELELRLKGTTLTSDESEYGELLNSFSRRHKGETVSLEEDEADLGAQVQVHGYVLNGVTYDSSDERIDIMLSAPNSGVVHLTRTIPGVLGVAVVARAGADSGLQITHGSSQTLLQVEGAGRSRR